MYALKFEQRIFIETRKCFVDAFKPHNHINSSGGNIDGLVILQNMDIRWSYLAIFIELIFPIWFSESSGNTTTPLRCDG